MKKIKWAWLDRDMKEIVNSNLDARYSGDTDTYEWWEEHIPLLYDREFTRYILILSEWDE